MPFLCVIIMIFIIIFNKQLGTYSFILMIIYILLLLSICVISKHYFYLDSVPGQMFDLVVS